MTKYLQSGMECRSLAEAYFVGSCEVSSFVRSVKRYDRKPLRYKVGGRWRKWVPSFIVETAKDDEFIVDVTPEYMGRGSRFAGRAKTDDPEEAARNQAHPYVVLLDCSKRKDVYRAWLRSSLIRGYEELN